MTTNIQVREGYNATMVLEPEIGFVCAHEDAYLSECLDGSTGVFCPARDCTGLEDYQVPDLIKRLV